MYNDMHRVTDLMVNLPFRLSSNLPVYRDWPGCVSWIKAPTDENVTYVETFGKDHEHYV